MKKAKPNAFNIVFKENNPQHKAVIDIINSKGRKKAQFIADAVCFFMLRDSQVSVSVRTDICKPETDQQAKIAILKGLSKFSV